MRNYRTGHKREPALATDISIYQAMSDAILYLKGDTSMVPRCMHLYMYVCMYGYHRLNQDNT